MIPLLPLLRALVARPVRPTLSVAMALALAGCAVPETGDRRLHVVTTFLPITLFTRAVAGDCARVTPLIPPGTGPHDFQARPGDLTALRNARVLVRNGLGMEGFLDKLVAAAGNPRLVVLDSSRGQSPLAAQAHSTEHGEDHGEELRQPHPGEKHPDRQSDIGAHHHHGAVNPHIWLDPLRAVQQVETIRDGLVRVDPACASSYRRNAATYTAALRRLNEEIAVQLRPYRGRSFVAFHDVAPYFAERYGLRAAFVVDVPELNPAPADLQRVAALVRSSQLRALLSEPQEGDRSFNALARDLGLTISVFDPLETGSEQASRDPGTYLAVMRRNVADLIRAFGG